MRTQNIKRNGQIRDVTSISSSIATVFAEHPDYHQPPSTLRLRHQRDVFFALHHLRLEGNGDRAITLPKARCAAQLPLTASRPADGGSRAAILVVKKARSAGERRVISV